MPGGHTPFHAHSFEHLNYVIEGKGTVKNEIGEERCKKGDFAMVMPGEKHQYVNSSDKDPMVMICAVPKDYE